MGASLEEPSTAVFGFMGRKQIVSLLHYLALSRFPSSLCPVSKIKFMSDTCRVCKQLSHGKPPGVSSCELGDTERKTLPKPRADPCSQ